MKLTIAPDKLIPFLKRIFWLAWLACRSPAGMGILQDKPDATEENVWVNVCNRGDYPGPSREKGGYYADYVFGRMMKLNLKVNGTVIETPNAIPSRSYQGWSREYKTYGELLERAAEEIGGINIKPKGGR